MLTGCTSPPVIMESEPESTAVQPEPTTVQPESVSEPEPILEPEPEIRPEPKVNRLPETESAELESADISEFLPTDKPINPGTKIEYDHIDKMKSPLEAGYGISETCELVGVYPGYYEKIPMLIRNGGDKERLFIIYAVCSTKPKEGFETLPEEYLYWFTVEEPKVELGKDEYRWINILFAMPKDADYAGKHAEVRIRVDDTTQTGFTQIALESKWYITTAE